MLILEEGSHPTVLIFLRAVMTVVRISAHNILSRQPDIFFDSAYRIVLDKLSLS